MTQHDAVDPLAVLPACSAQARGGRPNGRVTGVGSTIIAPLLSEHDGVTVVFIGGCERRTGMESDHAQAIYSNLPGFRRPRLSLVTLNPLQVAERNGNN